MKQKGNKEKSWIMRITKVLGDSCNGACLLVESTGYRIGFTESTLWQCGKQKLKGTKRIRVLNSGLSQTPVTKTLSKKGVVG